jgi:hypothetical protein
VTALSYADLGHRTSSVSSTAETWPGDNGLQADAYRGRRMLAATFATLLSLSVGTGASAPVPSFGVEASSSVVRCSTAPAQSARISQATPLSTREKLMALRRYFSLNVTELSRSLRVERPTAYSWLAESAEPHTRNLERLNRLYGLGRSWRRASPTPVGSANKIPLSNGRSLLDLISGEPLDQEAILASFPEIRALLAIRRSGPRNRQSVAEAGRRLGLRDVPRDDQQRSLDDETVF